VAVIGGSINPLTGRPRLPVFGGGAAALVADILLDFVNGVYRVDGTTYASAALAGFTGTGTFNASGYTPTGNQKLTGTVALPGDFIVFSEFVQPATDILRELWRHSGGSMFAIDRVDGSGEYVENPSSGGTSFSCTKIAHGRSGGVVKTSFDNGSVSTGGAIAVQGSASFVIGNTGAGDGPWSAAIRSIAIYKQTLSDAQIQALGAA